MQTERIGDLVLAGVEAGAVYVLSSHVPQTNAYQARDLLHVISKYRGGEVRGYEAVADLTGEPVLGLDGAIVNRKAA